MITNFEEWFLAIKDIPQEHLNELEESLLTYRKHRHFTVRKIKGGTYRVYSAYHKDVILFLSERSKCAFSVIVAEKALYAEPLDDYLS